MKSLFFLQSHWPHVIPSMVDIRPTGCDSNGWVQKSGNLRSEIKATKDDDAQLQMIECQLLLTHFNQCIPACPKSCQGHQWGQKPSHLRSHINATKDDDDLLEKKSVIFCWLTEVTLSLHPGKETQGNQTHHFGAHKNLANWGRIQRDEGWWWSTWKEESHLLLTHWKSL